MTNYDTSKNYIKYIDDVLNHKITTSKFIYQACERAKSWHNRDDIYMDYADVDKKIHFMQKLNTNYLSLEQLIAYEEQENYDKQESLRKA